MKAWKFLSAPLMLMLLACLQGNAAAADVTEPVKAGFEEGQEQHVKIDGNVKVEGHSEAVYVKSDAPGDAEDKSASARINGDVSATNQSETTAVFADAYDGNASAYVTGNVSAKADGITKGVYAYGNGYKENKSAIVEVGGSVTAESSSYTTGVESDNGQVNVGGNVTATTNDDGQSAYGVESDNDESITIGGDVKAESKNAVGVCAYTCYKTDIDIKGGVSATGKDVVGLQIDSYGNSYVDLRDRSSSPDEEQELGELSVKVGNGITATSNNTDEEFYGYSRGISFSNHGKSLLADITGDVVAESPLGKAVGIVTDHHGSYYYEVGGPFSKGKSEILVHGNVNSDGIGVAFDTVGEDTDVNVLVENEIKAKNVGVLLQKSYYADENSSTEPKLTVWKIQLNSRGNAAETMVTDQHERLGADGDSESNVTAATDFEKKIMYIIKVAQPGEGGTIKAVDKDGNDLLKSYDFDIAHEDEKVILKANLADGYKLVAAYNGDGEKVPLSQDENGNYYIIVPKGGGVYLSVELEGTTEHNKAETDDNTTTLDDETQESGSDSKDEIKPLDTDEKATSAISTTATATATSTTSNAIKTGDVTQVAPWLVLSVVSAGGIMSLGARGKREDKE